jgi:Flp pilus assembly pilin Flp
MAAYLSPLLVRLLADDRRALHRAFRDPAGATMVEYAIVLGAIAALAVAAVTVLGQQVLQMFQSVLPGFS